MKNIGIIIVVLMSFFDSYAVSDTLIYPNQPNIVFSAGSTYPVIWNACDLPDSTTVQIHFHEITTERKGTYLMKTTANSGYALIKLPDVMNRFDSVYAKVSFPYATHDTIIATHSFKLASPYYEVYVSKTDSLTISKSDSAYLTKYSPAFLEEIPYWVIQPKTATGSETISMNVDRTLGEVCRDEIVKTYDDMAIKVLKDGMLYFKPKSYVIMSLYSAYPLRCQNLLESNSTIRNFIPYTYIGRITPTFQLNAANDYIMRIGSIVGGRQLAADTIFFAQYPNYDKNISVYRRRENNLYLSASLMVVDMEDKIVSVAYHPRINHLPAGRYRIIGVASIGYIQPDDLLNRNLKEIFLTSDNGFIIGYNAAVMNILNDCDEGYSSAVNTLAGETHVKVSDYVSSGSLVYYNSHVSFSAGKSILLEPGFQAVRTSTFTAEIKGCNE